MRLFETATQKEWREARELLDGVVEIGVELKQLRAENARLRDEVAWLRTMVQPAKPNEVQS